MYTIHCLSFLAMSFHTGYIGLDKHLGETFDPMSTLPRDMAMFRECVTDLQREHGSEGVPNWCHVR